MKDNIIVNKSFDFAVKIIKLANYLEKEKRQYAIANQIIRSGTSIGANIREGVNASTKPDFRYKMSIALKEANETEYWIELIVESKLTDRYKLEQLLKDCKELCKILSCIVKNTKLK